MTETKTQLVKELQELKKTVNARITILESHLSSLRNVMQQDLDISTFEKPYTVLDTVLGDLDSGYFVQWSELTKNGLEIEEIRNRLESLRNET
ncbi:MAG: hypothetical protein K2W95_20605 [Candidatus Obscuribacterales bacterium]|nr:hypothetical protein [Candidatus Obscuribacterales bacterium]